ncbi:MAG: hypothetical protein ACYCU5_08635 [Actinomycetes bacterium]
MPLVDEDVTGLELDREVRDALASLPAGAAELAAKHLVMAGRLLEEDPDSAYLQALAARRLGLRVAAVREVVGMAAYASGRYAEALAELRAARRMNGHVDLLPVMADCERGLGRPQRALDIAGRPEARLLDRPGRIEMAIVVAGARRDLGQAEAAVVALHLPELRSGGRETWVARLRYAYADALLAAGRREEARTWFGTAAEADVLGLTDADERVAELDGITFVDALEDAPDDGSRTETSDQEAGGDEIADVEPRVDAPPAHSAAGEGGAPSTGTGNEPPAQTRLASAPLDSAGVDLGAAHQPGRGSRPPSEAAEPTGSGSDLTLF